MGRKLYILSEDGEQPIRCPDLHEWAEWYEEIDKRIVKQETVGDMWVSTVFLGIDHGWGDVPIVFETMVFNDKMKDLEMDRCGGNREQALAMHEAMVERVKAMVALEA